MSSCKIRQINDYANIWGCEPFFEEFNNLYRKDRSTDIQYRKWLNKKLLLLSTWNISDLIHQDAFEKITDTSAGYAIYSLRRPEFTGNPRILFTIVDSDSSQPRILLLAFKELHEDYHRFIPVAKKRLSIIVDDMKKGGVEL